MCSHSPVLGRYFDSLVASGDPSAFAVADPRSYARFRAERDPVTPDVAVCFAQLGAHAAFLAWSVRARRHAPRLWRAALAPAPAMPLLIALHTATGFSGPENAVLGGTSAAGSMVAARTVFLRWNAPPRSRT